MSILRPQRLSVPVAVGTPALVAGSAIALGPPAAGLLSVGAASILLGAAVWNETARRKGLVLRVWAVEIPTALLLVSTLVLRVRDARALQVNPLDAAGSFRALCVLLALTLGGLALAHPRERSRTDLHRPGTTLHLYATYTVVVVIGAFLSIGTPFTLYRALELTALIVVVMGALRVAGAAAPARIRRTAYAFIATMVAAVWIGAVLNPAVAWERIGIGAGTSVPAVQRLVGVFPLMAANLVGTFGALLMLLGVAGMLRSRRRRLATILALAGLVTLLVSQYRTGYVAVCVGAIVIMLVQRWYRSAALGAVVVILLVATGTMPLEQTESFLMRGQSTEAVESLSGRLAWWEAAMDRWTDSPLLGQGLLTASRFTVLSSFGDGTVSTLHSTWIEALLGTGLLGTALILAALLLAWWRAAALHRRGSTDLVALLFLAAITVRSLTANTIESFDVELLLFVAIATDLESRWRRLRPRPGVPVPPTR